MGGRWQFKQRWGLSPEPKSNRCSWRVETDCNYYKLIYLAESWREPQCPLYERYKRELWLFRLPIHLKQPEVG